MTALRTDQGQRFRNLYAMQVGAPANAWRNGWDVMHNLASLASYWTPVPSVTTVLGDSSISF